MSEKDDKRVPISERARKIGEQLLEAMGRPDPHPGEQSPDEDDDSVVLEEFYRKSGQTAAEPPPTPEAKPARLRRRALEALDDLAGVEAVCVQVGVHVYLCAPEAEPETRRRLAGVDFEGETCEVFVNEALTCPDVLHFWKRWGLDEEGKDPDPHLAERMFAHIGVDCDACWSALAADHGGHLSIGIGGSKIVMHAWNARGRKSIDPDG